MMPEERFKARIEKSLPLAEEFLSWAENLTVLPKNPIGRVSGYLSSQWKWLKNVYLDGRLELSNNRAGRSIKPFVIGRKNWLFCFSQKGAKASSIVYSIIETAKENDLKPFDYLKFLFERMPNVTTGEIDGLLPWVDCVPRHCKVPE